MGVWRGFAMMCLEDVQSQVEESTKSISNEARAQVNSEVNLEQIDLEQHSGTKLVTPTMD